MFFNDPEADACILLDLLLQVLGELLVALGGHNRKGVDIESTHSFAVLVHAKS